MISLVDAAHEEAFLEACRQDKIYGAMVLTRWKCYRHLQKLALFWVVLSPEGKPVGALSWVQGDCIFSSLHPSCYEEAAELLPLLPCESLLAEQAFVELAAQRLGGESYFSPAMVREEEGELSQRIELWQDSLRPIYQFLCEGYPYFAAHSHYDHWLSSLSLRMNRGCASVYVLREQEKLLACGIIGYRGEASGEIGGIVTAPPVRGRGLGREMVRHLTAVLAAEGRTAFLHLAEESLVPFYLSAGFRPAGRWGSLETE